MRTVFADAFYFLAQLNEHGQACRGAKPARLMQKKVWYLQNC